MLTIKKVAILPLVLVILIVISACSGRNEVSDQNTGSASSSSNDETADGQAVYPIQKGAELTYWLQSQTTLKPSVNDIPFYQEWQKRIGVPIRFSEVSATQAKESFSVMLASGNLPDIIEYNWLDGVSGGPEKALKDGYILRLNELIDQHAPNLKKYLHEHPDIDKLVKTDNGDYYAFPFLKEGGMTTQWAGPVLRKDWLQELNLDVPTTIDEWHQVLIAFKERKGVHAPLTFSSQTHALQGFLDGAFIGAFGVIRDFYHEDGKVLYGPLQPGYMQFLKTMNQWYEEGLLDPNFTQNDRKMQDANMMTGASGATVSSGANIDKWEAALRDGEPQATFVFAPYPVLQKGETPKFGQEAWLYGAEGSAAISTSSKHPELAVQVLDYAYGEEGYLLFNYGTEGQSFNWKDGKPELTELITSNPDNLSYLEALTLYTHTVNPGPYVESKELIGKLAVTNEDHNYDSWKTDNLKHIFAPVSISAEESNEFARIMSDVDTLVNEITLKVILGSEPADEAFRELTEKLESLGIGRALEIQQAAYDRFLNR
ncbi:extracellular solute-binding protein [Paenibacillus lautus]|uniref:extracellular solute-binding protein n=1 Tax=Paenibacillus lautus TaxID=1401 RepID=UPI001C110448|nr:extracellular solute-binding protein [Paenibacillus lautus]MBU5350141.1 extracellular solute-binding protein [Paenibacillus lautus]